MMSYIGGLLGWGSIFNIPRYEEHEDGGDTCFCFALSKLEELDHQEILMRDFINELLDSGLTVQIFKVEL